jgi:hypothetical protein
MLGMEKGYNSSEGNALIQQTALLHVVLGHLVFVQGWVLNSKLARLVVGLFPEARLGVCLLLSLPQLRPRLPLRRTMAWRALHLLEAQLSTLPEPRM